MALCEDHPAPFGRRITNAQISRCISTMLRVHGEQIFAVWVDSFRIENGEFFKMSLKKNMILIFWQNRFFISGNIFLAVEPVLAPLLTF